MNSTPENPEHPEQPPQPDDSDAHGAGPTPGVPDAAVPPSVPPAAPPPVPPVVPPPVPPVVPPPVPPVVPPLDPAVASPVVPSGDSPVAPPSADAPYTAPGEPAPEPPLSLGAGIGCGTGIGCGSLFFAVLLFFLVGRLGQVFTIGSLALPLILGAVLLIWRATRGIGIGVLIMASAAWIIVIGPCLSAVYR